DRLTISPPEPLNVQPGTREAERAHPPLPTGTVTFLLTDTEASQAKSERSEDAFVTALASHHRLLRQEFRRHRGVEAKKVGDGFLVAFESSGDALACAVAAQQALAAHPWPDEVQALRVRMALDTGDVEL